MAVNKSKQHKDICAMQAHEHLDQSSMCASSATHVPFYHVYVSVEYRI